MHKPYQGLFFKTAMTKPAFTKTPFHHTSDFLGFYIVFLFHFHSQ